MHISVDLGDIRRLTKYISPSDIEKTRLKNFKPEVIDDGNLLCDRFFKQEELFDHGIDKVGYEYRLYDIEDLPAKHNGEIERDITYYMTKNGSYTVESDLPRHIKLLKNGKKIYTENIFQLRKSHSAKIMIDKATEDGYQLPEIINILDSARINFGFKRDLFKGGLKMISEGYPLESVLHYMEMSKLTDKRGNKTYVNGTLDFLKEFPNLRDLFVVKDVFNNEVLDVVGMKYYRKILDMCKREKEAVEIVKSCQCYNGNVFAEVTDEKLLDTAIDLYTKDNSWTVYDSALMEKMKESKKLNLS